MFFIGAPVNNQLVLQVNGGAAINFPIIDSVRLSNSGNALIVGVNGIASPALNIISSNSLTFIAPNRIRSIVNGIADSALVINSALDSSSANQHWYRVNGVLSNPSNIVNSNTVKLTKANGLVSTLNGVAATQTIPTGTITNLLGYNNGDTGVWQSVSSVLSGSTTNVDSSSGNIHFSRVNGIQDSSLMVNSNVLSSAGNILTSNVNGVSDTTLAVNSVSNTSTGNNLSTTVNGVPGSNVTMINSATDSSAGNQHWYRVNGVLAGPTNHVNSVLDSSSANQHYFRVNGVLAGPSNIINSNAFRLQRNTAVSTVNGVAATQNIPLAPITNLFGTGPNATDSAVWQSVSAVLNGNTTNVDSSSGNIHFSRVNGIQDSSLSVNSNVMSSAGNILTSNVNGVSDTTLAVNSVTNTSLNNSLSTTVNGVAGLNVNIVNQILTVKSLNAFTSAVNGVSTPTATIVIDSVRNARTVNNINTFVNGVPSGPTVLIDSVRNGSTGNSMSTWVNGVTTTSAPIINTNTVKLTKANGLVSTLNGVGATQTIPAGTITNLLGYNNGDTGVWQSVASVLTGSTTNVDSTSGNIHFSRVNGIQDSSLMINSNVMSSAGNILTSNVNGVSDTTLAVNSVSNTSTGNNLSTTVNGVPGSNVNIINTATDSSSGNQHWYRVNGVLAGPTNHVNSVLDSTSANQHFFRVNGVLAGPASIINTATDSSAGNQHWYRVNGVLAGPTNIVNSNTFRLQRNTAVSTVNGVAATQNIPLAPITNLFGTGPNATDSAVWQSVSAVLASNTTNVDSSSGNIHFSRVNGNQDSSLMINSNVLSSAGNIITSNVNGVSDTTLAVNSVALTSTNNVMSSTVNGVVGTGVNIVNQILTVKSLNAFTSSVNGVSTVTSTTVIDSVRNGSTGNQLTTWVNGVASSPTAPIINTNTVKLTKANGLVSTLNGVAATQTIPTGTITNILGYNNGDTGVWQSVAGVLTGNTTNVDSTSGNIHFSRVNGIQDSSLMVNSNVMSSAGNILTSNVNGVSDTTLAVNSVSNTSTGNNLSTTVNGVAGSNVNIINSATDSSAGNQHWYRVNGVLAGPTNHVNSVLDSSSANQHFFRVNGVLAGPTNIVNSVLDSTSANQHFFRVNGQLAGPASIINSNTFKLTKANGAVSTLNGVAATQAIPTGTITNILGYNNGDTGVWQSVSGVLAGSTTNVDSTSGNIHFSRVNGIQDSALIINSNVFSMTSANTLTSNVNGVSSFASPVSTVLIQKTTTNVPVPGTIVPNSFFISINGVPSGNYTPVDSVRLRKTVNALNSEVNGVSSGATIVIDSVRNARTTNSFNTFVNGVASGATSIVDSVRTAKAVNAMTTFVNGVAGATTTVVDSVRNAKTVNSFNTFVNGVASGTTTVVDSVRNAKTVNAINTFVNGVASGTTTIIDSVRNGSTGNTLTTWVNGVASSPTASIINSNTLQLTKANGLVSTLNGVAATQTIPSGTVTNILGYNNGDTAVWQPIGSVLSGSTTNVDSTSGNIHFSRVNGIQDSSMLVNSVSTALVGGNFVKTTVNGVPSVDSAKVINTIAFGSFPSGGGTLNGFRVTINGFQSPGFQTIINTFSHSFPAANTLQMNFNSGKLVNINPINTNAGMTPKLLLGAGGTTLKVSVNGVVGPDSVPYNFVQSTCTSFGRVPRVDTVGLTRLSCGTILDSANSVWIGTGGVTGGTFAYTNMDVFQVNNGTQPSQNGTYKLLVDGDVGATGYIWTSDKTLKTDIKEIQNPNSIILGLEGKTYKWNDEYRNESGADGGTQYGFLAQDMEKVFPSAVVKSASGRYGVKYAAVIPVLVESQKALIKENEELKKEVNTMKERLYAIEKYLSDNGAKAIPTISNQIVLSSDKDVLFDATPNPTTGNASISYILSKQYNSAEIKFFAGEGKAVQTVKLDAKKGPGTINVSFGDLPSQIYLFSLIIDGQVFDTKKIQVAK
jgi:uncharacterized Rossmann fold enzyme